MVRGWALLYYPDAPAWLKTLLDMVWVAGLLFMPGFWARNRGLALGAASIPKLMVGLHSDVPLVRFASAESLAYLGSPSCGEELGKQVDTISYEITCGISNRVPRKYLER